MLSTIVTGFHQRAWCILINHDMTPVGIGRTMCDCRSFELVQSESLFFFSSFFLLLTIRRPLQKFNIPSERKNKIKNKIKWNRLSLVGLSLVLCLYLPFYKPEYVWDTLNNHNTSFVFPLVFGCFFYLKHIQWEMYGPGHGSTWISSLALIQYIYTLKENPTVDCPVPDWPDCGP